METSTTANQPLIGSSSSSVGDYESRPFHRRQRHVNFCALNDRQAAIVAAIYTIVSTVFP